MNKPVNTKKRLITVICVNTQDFYKKTLELIYDYSQRVNADLQIITQVSGYFYDKAQPHWEMLNQMRLCAEQSEYEEFLFIDIDVAINPTAGDIFEIEGTTLYAEEKLHKGDVKQFDDWIRNVYNFVYDEPFVYYNTGVIKTNIDDLKKIVSHFTPQITSHYWEQHYLNYIFKLCKLNITALPRKFNYMHPLYFDLDETQDFIHMASADSDSRLKIINKLKSCWT